jgi:ATP-dependent helicase/nuclease subunit A
MGFFCKLHSISLCKFASTITNPLAGLTIYRASAGSGKTHTLVGDYLDIIFSNPGKFAHVLAVTFTNKATAEMKKRILAELSALAEGKKSDFREGLMGKHKLTEEKLREKASDLLGRILQNYSRFYIETIDKFFQRVIRSFAREIRLQPAYTIEMSEDRILEAAVDRMLSEADQDKFLSRWLSEFADQKIIEGLHWNLKTDILRFSKEIFREKFRESSDELMRYLNERSNIDRYVNELNRYRYSFENRLKDLGDKAMSIISDSGLEVDDFSNKRKGPAGYLEKLSKKIIEKPGAYVNNSLHNAGGWYSQKSERKEEILCAYNSGLNEILAEVMDIMNREFIIYNSVKYTGRFLYILGILTDIERKIKDYLDERNVFLISDAAYFLKEIIGDNESPFIYEKTGNYFTHFMIDEFQDTSRMQWNNFKPLIENSLALNHQNLVVGDVKQSIYRFRNSDWEILAEGINNDFRSELLTFKSLTENHRSQIEIINFNNRLFRSCREVLGEKFAGSEDLPEGSPDFRLKLKNIYADIIQEVPKDQQKNGGYVEISFLESEDEKTWEEKSVEKVIQTIMMLQDHGYEPRDIAILVRKKEEGKRIADALLRQKKMSGEESAYRFDLLSDELLYLESSSPLRLILGVLKFLVDPGQRINKSELLNEYKRYISEEEDITDLHELFRIAGEGTEEDFCRFMPQGFTELSAELPYLSLNEITERIISLFELNRRSQDLAYLYAFQDILIEYSRSEPPDITSFLRWWDEYGTEKSLITSEEQNAIRVMTIHKAKGLQFPAVIIPYCSWNLDHSPLHPEILWCIPHVHPFDQLNLIPVRYSSGLIDTIFRNEYLLEKFRIHVDNLNLLYVALTRSQDSLFVMAPFQPEKNERLTRVSDLLGIALTQEVAGNELSGNFDRKSLAWITGAVGDRSQMQTMHPVSEFIKETVTLSGSKTRLRTRWHGTDFLEGSKEQGINSGKFIHEILQSIDNLNELEEAIQRAVREGKLNNRESSEISKEIMEFLGLEQVKGWFSGEWKVLKERDIITAEGQLRRPDRIMMKGSEVVIIDYKTGRSKLKVHERQMKDYIGLVRKMGYKDVKGWLCYIRLKEIIQIQD